MYSFIAGMVAAASHLIAEFLAIISVVGSMIVLRIRG
jgi:hypothetical protein